MNLRIILSTCLILISLATAQAAEPVDPHAAIHPYLTDDVVAVAFVDVRAINVPAMLELAKKSGWLYPEDIEEIETSAIQVAGWIKQLEEAGLKKGYVTYKMSDIKYRSVQLLMPVVEGKDPEVLLKRIKEIPDGPPYWQLVGNVWLGGEEQQVKETITDSIKGTPRQEILDSLSALSNGDAGLAIVGDRDSRRVVREMMPALPAPFQAIDGKFIADELTWGGISAKLPPKLHAALEIQTASENSAQIVQDQLTKAIGMGQTLIAQGAKNNPDQGFEKVAEALGKLRPRVDENRVVVSLGESPEEFAALVDLIAQPVKAARVAAYRSQRINNIKQIMLAALNYESANKAYPAQAIVDADGKPLLSWRVAILPYLEQQALYNQFRLDEPWDSEHNLKLAEIIPAPYLDPDPAIARQLKGPGYTTFLGVAGPGTIFDGKQGTPIKAVTDGLSNTVFVVEVSPERAVPWTKPADWEVDFDKPFDGVERQDRQGFVCGFCDGSARYIAPDHPGEKKNWTKQLTIAGGELIEW